MLQLHVVQAEYGDCLLLEYGTSANRRFTLIDGGPPFTFERNLEPVLTGIQRNLDLVVLSHVDNDHVVGLLDYFTSLQSQNGNGPLPGTDALWHNSFHSTLDPNGLLQSRLQALMTNARAAVMSNAGAAVNGIAEGNSLRQRALLLGIAMNQGFQDDLIIVDTAPAPIQVGSLTIRIAGPTQANLDALQTEWQEWLDANEDAIDADDPFVMANADRSIPNLSSIMFLAEEAGRTILLTGDGRSDHLLTGLNQAGLLDADGKLHVDVLKLPHHGSNRNATKTFFRKVTADIYVASANGRDDNPDLATLIWIVEAAKDQNRQIELVVTNRTHSVQQLIDEYDSDEYGYAVRVLSITNTTSRFDGQCLAVL